MQFKDIAGNKLEIGDTVSLAVGSELGAGTVVAVNTGIGLEASQPYITIQINVVKQAFPNGIVPQILAVRKPDITKAIIDV